MKRCKVTLEFVVDDWDDVTRDGNWTVVCNAKYLPSTLISLQQGKPNTTYVRNMRRRRRKAGLCSTCGAVPQEGYIRCANCREYSMNAEKKQNDKRMFEVDLDINYAEEAKNG
tara:strand:+ start:3369 stop:3707 length:339 start_codon:yes stop_codon:yes gene_type:complete